MATLRIDKKPSGNYLSIIESYRDTEGKARMRTLANLGKAEDYNPDTLKRMGLKLFQLAGGNMSDLKDYGIEEQARYNFGYVQMINKLIGYFGLQHICSRIKRSHRLNFDFGAVLTLMLIERLGNPCSKLANFNHQNDYFDLPPVELHWMYRSLDKIDQYCEAFQNAIFLKGRHLFNQKLDIVFYDVTTLYFDSQQERENTLAKKGYSKDGKVGKNQVVLGMFIDKHKQPIGYQLFEGNTYEGHSLKLALEELLKRFSLQKIIVVADRGMLSKDNIKMVTEELGLSYIFGERLKNKSKAIQNLFLDIGKYDKQWTYNRDGKAVKIQYYSVEIGKSKTISTYSKNRAKKDKHDREKKVAKAKELLKQPSKLENKARVHYLQKDSASKYELNEEKIKRDELFDGILAITTSELLMDDIEVLEQYKQLFQADVSLEQSQDKRTRLYVLYYTGYVA